MLDRTIAPKAQPIDNINFVLPDHWKLTNGIPVYSYHLGSEDVIKLDFVFPGGTKYQTKSLIASTVKNVLKEGTDKYSSKEIADAIDFYGAFLETELNNDYATVSLYCLNKHMDNVLPIVLNVITNASFPQNEIDKYLNRSKQNYLLGQEKVATLSSQAYVKTIFNNSEYGQVATEEDYEQVTREDLLAFYKKHYALSEATVFIAGNVSPVLRKFIEVEVGQLPINNKSEFTFNFTLPNYKQTDVFIEKRNAIQSAIRFGKPTIKIDHEDFNHFQILNTVLGGYFGSRLMMNIREDKGYTYGIGSGLSSKNEIGNFIISTEVGSDVTKDAIKEIQLEIDKIKTELIPEKELSIVKNYILGSLLKNTDGPFDLLERYKTIHFNGLANNHYDLFIQDIHSATPEKLREIANKYLTDLSIIVAGSVDFR